MNVKANVVAGNLSRQGLFNRIVGAEYQARKVTGIRRRLWKMKRCKAIVEYDRTN